MALPTIAHALPMLATPSQLLMVLQDVARVKESLANKCGNYTYPFTWPMVI
jgi:hypothetical protein